MYIWEISINDEPVARITWENKKLKIEASGDTRNAEFLQTLAGYVYDPRDGALKWVEGYKDPHLYHELLHQLERSGFEIKDIEPPIFDLPSEPGLLY